MLSSRSGKAPRKPIAAGFVQTKATCGANSNKALIVMALLALKCPKIM